jgi:hypothetical protein
MSSANKEWRGYSLRELSSRRAETLARIEIEKVRLAVSRKNALLPSLLKAVSLTEYIVVGMKLWRHIAPLLRRRKR